MDIQIGPDGFQLCLSPQAGSADTRAFGQTFYARVVSRAEGVARILALGNGGDFESLGKFGRQVFQRVHGKIDSSGRERLFALWTREALPLNRDELRRLAEEGELAVSEPYRATRDMARIQELVGRLGPSDWPAAVLELDHHPC